MAALHHLLLPRQNPMDCTPETCTPSDSIMGYAPTLAPSILFTVLFGLSTLTHLAQGIHFKTPSFLLAMTLGNISSLTGCIARILLSTNPFSIPYFNIQIVLLTLAPAFYSAGIYLQLKHLVLTFGTAASRLRPQWYTYIFIVCDLLSIALQGAGGGLSATADGDAARMDLGQGFMMAGLTFQVATLLVFGALVVEYFVRVRRAGLAGANATTHTLRASRRFRAFLVALAVAYGAILIRCVYRIIEMAGGWGNEIMRDEIAFLVLDSGMVAVAVGALSVFHPGWCFRVGRVVQESEKDAEVSSREDVRV